MSSIDVFDIKQTLARETPFTETHLDYERFDYPLIESMSKERLLPMCNKLASGDYITSFASTFFQIATYKMMARDITVNDYLCGGDDAALLLQIKNVESMLLPFKKNHVARKTVHDLLVNKNISNSNKLSQYIEAYFKEVTGDEIQHSKSFVDVVAYNRRM